MLKNLIARAGIKAALSPIAEDMRRVDETIRRELGSGIRRVSEVAEYITGSGGKRMRPALVLLIARAMGYTGDKAVFLGAVTDFLDFHWGTLHWPAFNVADTAIVVGVALLVLSELRGSGQASKP